jgi:hypothetical protein
VTAPAPLARHRERNPAADFGYKEADVLKKTSASIGLIVAAVAGAPLTSTPAYAHANLLQGRHSHHHHSHHSSHNRNWNANRHRPRIFIRIYVYNKNNNRAQAVIARPAHREDRSALAARDADPIAGSPAGAGGVALGDD